MYTSHLQATCIILKEESYSTIICVFSASYLPCFDVLNVSYSWVIVKAQKCCAIFGTDIFIVTLEDICRL